MGQLCRVTINIAPASIVTDVGTAEQQVCIRHQVVDSQVGTSCWRPVHVPICFSLLVHLHCITTVWAWYYIKPLLRQVAARGRLLLRGTAAVVHDELPTLEHVCRISSGPSQYCHCIMGDASSCIPVLCNAFSLSIHRTTGCLFQYRLVAAGSVVPQREVHRQQHAIAPLPVSRLLKLLKLDRIREQSAVLCPQYTI